MTILAIVGIPTKFSVSTANAVVTKAVRLPFKPLTFKPVKLSLPTKTFYVRLGDGVDPQEFINALRASKGGKLKLNGYVPDSLPPFVQKFIDLNKDVNNKTKYFVDHPEKVIVVTHREILKELQSKYTGLFVLSKKHGHQLLHIISMTIADRLKVLVKSNTEAAAFPTKLGRLYRNMHPHFCDFQLILGTLHAIQDAAAAQRTHLVESQLMEPHYLPDSIDNIPMKEIMDCKTKYSDKIIKTIVEHLNNLKSETDSNSLTEEEIARNKIREELRKLSPFMSPIIKQMLTSHLAPKKPRDNIRIRIYGEPYLPKQEKLMPLFKGLTVTKVLFATRSSQTCNMMSLTVPQRQYEKIMALDQKEIGDAKLIVRLYKLPFFKSPLSVINDMISIYGVAAKTEMDVQDEDEIEDRD